jgi:peroxiredoxin Q/BCP
MNIVKRVCFLACSAWCLGALLCGSVWGAEPKAEGVNVGDPAPVFECTDDMGKAWKSTDHVGKKILVVYFYPADLTGGCAKQACSFRDDMEKLTAKGVNVVGVSGDSVENHQLFKKDQKLNFTLLADETGGLAKKFGVPFDANPKTANVKDASGKPIVLRRSGTAKRWTFVIGKDGKVLYKNTEVKPAEDSKQILAVVEKQAK